MEENKNNLPAKQSDFYVFLERMATNPEVDVSKIEKFMEMQEHILERDAKQAFNAAMVRAQNRIKLVVTKEWNDQTKSRYADLKAVVMDTKNIYTEEGFSLMFYEGETLKENHIRVGVDIMHAQGHTEKRHADIAVQTTGIAGKAMMTLVHGQGSAFSYGRRYLTCMIFNIPTGDDNDGNVTVAEYITDQQKSTIVDYINDKEVNEAQFLKYVGASSVEQILASDYDKAIKALRLKKKREPGQEG